MEKTLFEPSEVESHQPHLGSAVGLRHGELKTFFPLLFNVMLFFQSMWFVETFVTQVKSFIKRSSAATVCHRTR